MSGYNIYVSDYNRTKVLQFPTIPKELPAFSSESKNEEFETYWDIPYNFIEKKGYCKAHGMIGCHMMQANIIIVKVR